jgi:hypothetical protein
MAGKLVDTGENRVQNILFGAQAVDNTLYLGLYTNSTEPAETAVLGDLTVPSGSGYATIALTRGTWTITNDLAEYAQQEFEAVGGDWGNVYGYYIATSEDLSGVLLFVEQFTDAPFEVNDGDIVRVTPNITCA